MAERTTREEVNRANDTLQRLTKTTYEINQTITRGAVSAQERNIRYTQNLLNHGIDMVKGQVEASNQFMQQITKPQESNQTMETLMDSALAMQKRYVDFTQNIIEQSGEMFLEHAKASRDLTQTLLEQTQAWQKTLQTLFLIPQAK
jgi:hypothetical protein